MANSIEKIPEELWLNIFGNLSWKDLGQVAQVCKTWRRIANDHTLWSPYFCLARGIMRYHSPTSYLSITDSSVDQYRIFQNHVAYLGLQGFTITEIDSGKESVVPLPFQPTELYWLHNGAVGLNDHQMALVDVKNCNVVKVFERGKVCFFSKEVEIAEVDEGLEVSRLDGTVFYSISKSQGSFVSAECKKGHLALILQHPKCQALLIFNLESGQLLYEKRNRFFTGLDITDAGHILFEIDHKFCGIYSLTLQKAVFHLAVLDRDNECSPQFSKRYFICFPPDRYVRICSLETGAVVQSFSVLKNILCAAVWEERFILYTADGVFTLWDIKSKALLLTMEIVVQATEGDCIDLPNISHNVIAIKTGKEIIFVDLHEGRILRRIESSNESSDLFFHEGDLREIGEEKQQLTIVNRKFF